MKTSTHYCPALSRKIPVAVTDNAVWFPLSPFSRHLLGTTATITRNKYLDFYPSKLLKVSTYGPACIVVTLDALLKLTSMSKRFNASEVAEWAKALVDRILDSSALEPEVLAPEDDNEHLPDPGVLHSEEVQVCGSTIMAVVSKDGKLLFSPRHVCAALSIDWSRQLKKIKEDQILNTCVALRAIQLPGDSQAREFTLLPIEYLTGWLFTIRKAGSAAQGKLNAFRAEGYKAIDSWFRGKYYVLGYKAESIDNEHLRKKVLNLEAENILLRKETIYWREEELRKQMKPLVDQVQQMSLELQRLEIQQCGLQKSYEAKQAELTALSTPPTFSINSHEIRS